MFIFPCSTDHEQDWQPYTVDPCSVKCDDHAYSLNSNEDHLSPTSTVLEPPPRDQDQNHLFKFQPVGPSLLEGGYSYKIKANSGV